jgi:hypothetical protein
MDVESTLFRMIDETLTGYLSCHPSLVSVRIEWSPDQVEARIAARRDEDETAEGDEAGQRGKGPEIPIPGALQAMIEEQRADAEAARAAGALTLPAATWREIQQRAQTIGGRADLLDEGRQVVILFSGH